MTWQTPSLADTRKVSRDSIAAKLAGADATIPNNPLRVISDANAGLATGEHQYIAALVREFLPDTASALGLFRWGVILNLPREAATFASGSVNVTGASGLVLPAGSLLAGGVHYQTTADTTMGGVPVAVPVVALATGEAGNLDPGTSLQLSTAVSGIQGTATVIGLTGGVDLEDIESWRDRILARIRKPPMGGDADDYVAWAREVPGVTRAWCAPNEMGPGTVTVRFMMDVLRATAGGFPTQDDVAIVQAHVDNLRPVSMRDCFVVAPVPEPVGFTISNLTVFSAATQAAIAASVSAMLQDKAAPARAVNGMLVPAQTIFQAWVSAAILAAAGVDSFDLTMLDHPMPTNGSMAVLGTISYA